MTCYGCINPNNACKRCKERLNMNNNVTTFPNPDEVISDEDQEQAEYDADSDRGYARGLEYRRRAYLEVEDMNEAEEAGFWDGYWG